MMMMHNRMMKCSPHHLRSLVHQFHPPLRKQLQKNHYYSRRHIHTNNNTMEEEEEEAKVYDVVSLFSTPRRDFLIRNNGEKVKVDSLKGKIVGIYFARLSLSFEEYISEERTSVIKEVYDDLSMQNNFQVVFVAEVNNKKLFDEVFSRMPWLAIPQDDKESIRKVFSIAPRYVPALTILDDKGKILHDDAYGYFYRCGAECYPFTRERLIEIQKDDISARFAMSVKRLLTTPTRDYLIRNNFEKVPVSDLEGKVVAFYCYMGHESITHDLIELYEKLVRMGKNFEIVFINSRHVIYYENNSYMEAFKRTPFLGLPSNDRSYLKLLRIFDWFMGGVVIVNPGEEFPDECGWAIIRDLGIKAYPFTRQSLTENEVARLKSLTLESILFSGHCKYIQGNGGQKITAHHLVNKTVLLLFTQEDFFTDEKHFLERESLLTRLITWYNEIRDLEIIHISRDFDPAKECYSGITTMPWLQYPYNEEYNEKLFCEILNVCFNGPIVVAFGCDGKILTRNAWLGEIDYPFTDVDFYEEVAYDLAYMNDWLFKHPIWSQEEYYMNYVLV